MMKPPKVYRLWILDAFSILLCFCGPQVFAAPMSALEIAGWRSSAEKGVPVAQCVLGSCYEKGDGVPKDNVMAYMWSNIAAASGDHAGAKIRESASKEMTPEQIAKARQMSQEWKPKKENKRRRFVPLPQDRREVC